MPRPRKKRAPSGPNALGLISRFVLVCAVSLAAVAGGYAWRSYYPVALPFESPLTADASSEDLHEAPTDRLLDAAVERAERAEQRVVDLEARLASLEEAKREAEREIGDLKIKSVLQSRAE